MNFEHACCGDWTVEPDCIVEIYINVMGGKKAGGATLGSAIL